MLFRILLYKPSPSPILIMFIKIEKKEEGVFSYFLHLWALYYPYHYYAGPFIPLFGLTLPNTLFILNYNKYKTEGSTRQAKYGMHNAFVRFIYIKFKKKLFQIQNLKKLLKSINTFFIFNNYSVQAIKSS